MGDIRGIWVQINVHLTQRSTPVLSERNTNLCTVAIWSRNVRGKHVQARVWPEVRSNWVVIVSEMQTKPQSQIRVQAVITDPPRTLFYPSLANTFVCLTLYSAYPTKQTQCLPRRRQKSEHCGAGTGIFLRPINVCLFKEQTSDIVGDNWGNKWSEGEIISMDKVEG